jgi:hypothetical protein
VNIKYQYIGPMCAADRSPQLVADDPMSLSRFLINWRGTERVVVCEILQRAKANRHFQISLEDFQSGCSPHK